MLFNKTITRFFLLCILGLLHAKSFATHNLGGYMYVRTTCTSSINTCTSYEINYVTFTSTLSSEDPCFLTMIIDGVETLTLPRVNGPIGSCPAPATMGEVTPGTNIKKNIYRGTHTFPGPGSYSCSFQTPNRNAGLQNMPNSGNIPLYVETTFGISGILGNNSTAQLLNIPIIDVDKQEGMTYNLQAYDPDGDCLTYELVKCRGLNGDSITGYSSPEVTGGGAFTVDSLTGQLKWTGINKIGSYAYALKIREWRGKYVLSTTTVDLQINVANVTHDPFELNTSFWKKDPDGRYVYVVNSGQQLKLKANTMGDSLTAVGEPLINGNGGIVNISGITADSVNAEFTWTPQNKHIRCAPYFVNFRNQTNSSTRLYKDNTVLIYVNTNNSTCNCKSPLGIIQQEAIAAIAKVFTYQGKIKVEMLQPIVGTYTLSLTDLAGRALATYNVSEGSSQEFRLNELSTGIYLYSISQAGKQLQTGKLWIQ